MREIKGRIGMSWFRMHTEILHHRVVATLPSDIFKAWVKILCLAKLGDGIVPNVQDIAFQLRCGVNSAERWTSELVNDYGLLESNGDGTFRPKNWNKHQYVSDVSTDRVKRFRERKGNVSRNQIETPPETEYRDRVQKQTQNRAAIAPPGRQTTEADTSFFTEIWRKWKRQRRGQPMQVVFQLLLSADSFDWEAFRANAPVYIDWCDRMKPEPWKFCSLSLWEWVEGGMILPPEAKTEENWMDSI